MAQFAYIADVSADTTLVTSAETVLATLSNVSSQRPGQTIWLEGDVWLTTGTGTTAVALRIREDSLTGTVVDEPLTQTIIGAAGSSDPYHIAASHSPSGEVASKTYVLTASQTGATANGTATHAAFKATVGP